VVECKWIEDKWRKVFVEVYCWVMLVVYFCFSFDFGMCWGCLYVGNDFVVFIGMLIGVLLFGIVIFVG